MFFEITSQIWKLFASALVCASAAVSSIVTDGTAVLCGPCIVVYNGPSPSVTFSGECQSYQLFICRVIAGSIKFSFLPPSLYMHFIREGPLDWHSLESVSRSSCLYAGGINTSQGGKNPAFYLPPSLYMHFIRGDKAKDMHH